MNSTSVAPEAACAPFCPVSACAKEVTLTVPYPPSVNNYWRLTPKGALISRAGRDYRKRASLALWEGIDRHNHPFPFRGRLHVSVELHMPDRRRRDVDNTSKALLDALTKAGVWLDDEQIDALTLWRSHVVPGGLCRVTVAELPDGARP